MRHGTCFTANGYIIYTNTANAIRVVLIKSFKTNSQLKLEVIILTKQIEILQRTNPKLKIKNTDRLVFSIIKDLLSTWKEKLFIVKPETVIKWHRTAFRTYWRIKSKHKEGRPKVEREVMNLIRQIANENPLWGVPRIHGELDVLFRGQLINCLIDQQIR